MSGDLIFWSDIAGIPHALYSDMTEAFGHEMTTEVTSDPVETGVEISDHVLNGPDTLTFTLRPTETPIEPDRVTPGPTHPEVPFAYLPHPLKVRQSKRIPWNVQGLVTTGLNATKSLAPVVASALSVPTPQQRIQRVYEQLITLHRKNYEIKVVFRGRIYKPYILTSTKLDYDPQIVGSAVFSCTARKIRKTSTLVALPLDDPALSRARAELAAGAAAKKTADAQRTAEIEKAKGRTVLKGLSDDAVSAFGGVT